ANEMHETPWSERFRATAEVTARTALAAGIMLWGLSKVLSAHQAAMAHRLDPVGASASARDIGPQL
ncbi:MAG: hypothetical protein AAF526_05855, partial [Pseudomonadota bacterium]